MNTLQDVVVAALLADLDEHKERGFTDVVYKPMVTLLRVPGDETDVRPGIPNSLISAYVELIFGAEAYRRVINGGHVQGAVGGYRASAVGSQTDSSTVNLAIRLV